MASKHYLVTGADGFIGSHLAEELVRRGHRVRAMVLYESRGGWGWLDESPAEIRSELQVFQSDIRDPRSAAAAVDGVERIIHLAALIAIPYSYLSPDSYIDTNIKGTLNLLMAARDHGVERFVQTSTSEVYGTARTAPIPETHALSAQSPYAASKIGADQLALSCHASFGLPVTVMRPFNTYGPRQSARAVIPTVITQLAAGERRVRLGSVHPTRDFSFVSDTVAGLIAGAESPQSVGETINLGSGFEIPVGETAKLIGELMGREIEIVQEDSRIRPAGSEVERLLADTTLAKKLLGWKPVLEGREGFRKGLLETIAWFTRPQSLARYRPGTYQL